MQETRAASGVAERMENAPPWIAYYKPRPAAYLRLFCFHYAGGSASAFRTWSDVLSEEIEVCPIQLPGREQRLWEPLFTGLSSLLGPLTSALQPYMDLPFAFFGHSMGALVAFELARELRRRAQTGPVHLFASGCRAPQLANPSQPVHLLRDGELIEFLRHLKGTPEPILQNADLMQLLLPMIRADFTLCETYAYEQQEPLPCPISCYGGMRDNVTGFSHLTSWREQTRSSFIQRMFPGDHFFLHSAQIQLLQTIGHEIKLRRPTLKA